MFTTTTFTVPYYVYCTTMYYVYYTVLYYDYYDVLYYQYHPAMYCCVLCQLHYLMVPSEVLLRSTSYYVYYVVVLRT